MIFFSYGNFLMEIKLFQLHLLVCLSPSHLQCLIYFIPRTHLHLGLFLGCLEIPLINSVSTNILHKEAVDFRSCGSISLIYLFMFGLLLSYYLTYYLTLQQDCIACRSSLFQNYLGYILAFCSSIRNLESIYPFQ